MKDTKDKNSLKDYFQVNDVFRYFLRVFKKRDPNEPSNFNIRMMHGINRISIVIFVLAFFFWLAKRIFL